MKAIKTIDIKVTTKNLCNDIIVVQADTGRSINFAIADIVIPLGAEARLYAVKPDGKEIYNNCIVSNNVVTVNLTSQTLALVGVVRCQIRITSGNDIVTTFEFGLKVEKSLMSDSAIQSKDEFIALDKAMKTVDGIDDNITKLNENLEKMFPGGTNILRNTNILSLTSSNSWLSGAWAPEENGGKITTIDVTDAPNPDISIGVRVVGASSSQTIIKQGGMKLIEGTEYTLSCYCRKVSGSPRVVLQHGGTNGYKSSIQEITSGEWHRVTYTATATGESRAAFGTPSGYSGTIEICGMKLESGNKATDWSPSPWDVGSVPTAANDTGYTILPGGLKMCWGRVSITPTAANAPTSIPVKFPITFSFRPMVVPVFRGTTPGTTALGVAVSDESVTGCTLTLTRTTIISTTHGWFAIGK